MKIVDCDLHTRYQQIAVLDTETGELIKRRPEHATGEARAFYVGLQGPMRVGIEATGHTAGSSACWPSWDTSYGAAMRRRSGRAMVRAAWPGRSAPT